MNLNPEQLEELNGLLRNQKLDLPEFRRSVNVTGNNYSWLQRQLLKRNKNVSPRLLELLNINSAVASDRLKELLNTKKFASTV